MAVLINGKREYAIVRFKVEGGKDTCLAGFLCHHTIPYSSFFDGQIVQVVELHGKSPIREVHGTSYVMKGSTKAVLL